MNHSLDAIFTVIFLKSVECVKFSKRKKYDYMLSDIIMLSDNMLSDNIILSVVGIRLSDNMLSDNMLSDNMLSDNMLSYFCCC
jgi:hypothetical protein